MAQPMAGTDESLDAILGREQEEINELLKKAGADIDPTGIIDNGEAEQVPPPATSETDLQAETPEPVEPQKEPDKPEPQKEPEPVEPAGEPQAQPQEPPKKREPVPVWKALRDAERRLKEVEAENLRLKSQPAPQPPPQEPQFDEQAVIQELDDNDPIVKLQREHEALKQRLANQETLNEQSRTTQTIIADENRFKQQHPDYEEALGYITQRARQRFGATGELEETMQEVLSKHHNVIDNVLAAKGIPNASDDQLYQTAEDIAFAVLFEQERQKFVARNMKQGKSIAAEAYKLAESEGYKFQAVQTPATPPPTPQPTEADRRTQAQKRVQQQAKIANANQSLSAMQNSGTPRSLMVKTKAEFMRMSPEQQDKLIEQMEDIDPDWHQKLQD